MEFQYYLVYLVVNIICIAFALTIYARLSGNIGSGIEIKLFKLMLVMYMAFLVCEIIWSVGVGGFLPVSPRAGSIIKVIGTAFIPIMVYMWFLYAEIRFENSLAYTPRFRVLAFIPLGIMLLVYLSTPATKLVADVATDGTMIPGPMIALNGLIDNIYGVAVVAHAIILMIRDRSRQKRRVYITHILFIAICTVGGIADAVISGTPIMPLAIMLSYTVLFINLQESKINNDALTGLNNRRRADRYINDLLEETGEEHPFCLFLIDIDDFKSINEKFGYVEGDKTLNAVSDSLRSTVGRWNGFTARWSGDEFLAIIKTGSADDIREFRDELARSMKKAAQANDLPCEITVSTGREIVVDGSRTPAEIINSAEIKLYEVKASKGVGR